MEGLLRILPTRYPAGPEGIVRSGPASRKKFFRPHRLGEDELSFRRGAETEPASLSMRPAG